MFLFCVPRVCTGLRNRDHFGAFSRFCMLLLKASCCISFCLSLPTCKMGLIPPTSLTSPSSSTQLGQGAIASHSAPLGSGVGVWLRISPPLPCHPLPTPKTFDGVEFEHSGILWLPILCSAVPRSAQFQVPKQCLKQSRRAAVREDQSGEPSLGVSHVAQGSGRRGGVGRPIAGPSWGPRWFSSDHLGSEDWNSVLGRKSRHRFCGGMS